MAVLADDVVRPPSIWHLITDPSLGRLAFAARLALICALVAIVAEVYQTPEIALTVYIVFFLNKEDRASSILTTVALTIVLTLIIALLVFVAQFVLSTPEARVLTMTVLSFCMLYLASSSKLKPLASTVALIVAYALDVIGSAPMGEAVTRALLYAWLFVGIPALVSVVVNLLLAPSPRSIVQKELAERLSVAAEALLAPHSHAASEFTHLVSQGDAEIQSHLNLAGLEMTSNREDLAPLQGSSDCVVAILSAVQLMLSEPIAMPSGNVRHEIHSRLLELASIFTAGGYPAKVEPIAADAECTNLATSAVAFLNSGLTQFGESRPKIESKSAEDSSGFFLADAFTNPIHVHFAIKTTAAAMLCYLIYSGLSWPGIHTALITCFIVSLGTAAESVEKLTLRIVGCLIGAGLGLLVLLRVIPGVTSIGGLAVIVFTGAFFGAWIAVGDRRISYAGFQMAFAFFLCVIQGSSPSFDLVVARDRVIGILLGNIVSYFMATQVWPLSVGPRIDKGFQGLRHHLGDIADAVDGWSRRRATAEAHSMLNDIASDLHLADYEPASVRPARTWLDRRIRVAEQAQKLESPLLAVAELASAQTREHLRDCLENIPSDSAAVQNSTSPSKTLATLEALLRSRITSFQKAMSDLNQAEEHG
jgi:multidrug resistance protein MdtO